MDLSKWCVKPKNDEVMAIIEEIYNAKVASITVIEDNMIADNWVVKPVLIRKGNPERGWSWS